MKIFSLFLTFWLLTLTNSQEILKGINIYGLETPLKNFVCSWVNPVQTYIDKTKELGFNSLRIPFSAQWVFENDFSKMDSVFDHIKGKGISVILDLHRMSSSGQSAEPATNGYTLDDFLRAWTIVIDRYKDRPELIAIEPFNEYQGSNATYWNSVMNHTLSFLEDHYPQRFQYFVGGHSWGGSLKGIDLEFLPFHDRISYTVHKYIFSGNSVPSNWDESFGKHPEKVIVTEWGFKNLPEEIMWVRVFIDYLKQHNVRNAYFWTVAHSGDTGGLWMDDCQTIEWNKYNLIKTLWEYENLKLYLRGSLRI